MTTTSALSRNFPTLRYVVAPFRWAVRTRRRRRIAAAIALAMLVAPPLWWSIQLLGLPDVGEPFDAEAFRALSIPDDRNAMVLYRRAAEQLKVLGPPPPPGGDRVDPRVRWSKATPIVRGWVERNREAIEIFRRGADRPDALFQPLAYGPEFHDLRMALHSFQELALLEASRLEDEGDMAGAWDWYRAALRGSYHVGLRGSIFERRDAEAWRGQIRPRLGTWAADPRTTPAMLRRALDDLLACEALMPSESHALKADYLLMARYLEGSENPSRGSIAAWMKAVIVGSTLLQLDSGQIRTMFHAWKFWRREPERSRRVLRLVTANWLAYYDLPPDRRPPPDPDVSGPFDFYALGPEAPAGARALSPRALDRWLATTMDAQDWLMSWEMRSIRLGERVGYRALVVLLASQLYCRDHGREPDSEQDLVGPYLKSLPDDGFGDASIGPAAVGVR